MCDGIKIELTEKENPLKDKHFCPDVYFLRTDVGVKYVITSPNVLSICRVSATFKLLKVVTGNLFLLKTSKNVVFKRGFSGHHGYAI